MDPPQVPDIPAKPGRGRRPWLVLYPDRAERLLYLIERGVPFRHASSAVRLSESGFYKILSIGRELQARLDTGDMTEDMLTQNEVLHVEFLQAVREREAICVERNLNLIQAAAENDPKHWTASMALLERRWPDQFSRPPSTLVQHVSIEQQASEIMTTVKAMKESMRPPPALPNGSE